MHDRSSKTIYSATTKLYPGVISCLYGDENTPLSNIIVGPFPDIGVRPIQNVWRLLPDIGSAQKFWR
ncbi:4874_t:CDS:2, partial [Ambispora leptoticha]